MSLPYGSSNDDTFIETWKSAAGPFAWLRAVNNSPIGKRFLVTGFAFFLIGGIQALFMRLQLAKPENNLMSPELYNQLMSMHGSTMLFLFVVPILEGLATLLAPSMLGTRDLPFPRLTAFAYWAYLFGGVLMYSSFLLGVAPNGGWFAYVPLTGPEFSPGINMDFWLLGLELAEASGIISAFELIIAVLAMRAPGMTLGRIPVFLWAMLVASSMILFAFMTVLIASLYLELDRKLGTAFFSPELGGSTLLWQHLFWFFGHPEVYIQFLPAAGIVSMIIPVFCRQPLVSYTAVVLALVSTGVMSFGLWAHHMFTTGMPDITASFFSTMSIVVAIPTGLQFFVWIATIWRGKVIWKTPMLFVMGFMVNFLIGGLTGVMLGVAPFDWQVHDSYFVVAHFHYVLIGGVVFPLIAGFYYWMPKITGKLMGERLGRWNFWLMFVGFNVAFFPMHLAGFRGMPRRVYTYIEGIGLANYNLISTLGAFIFATGILVFVLNFLASLRQPNTDPNPWGAYSLEWATSSPPPPYAFLTLPIVKGRYPLWEQEQLDKGDEETVDMVKTLASWPLSWQAGVVTDVFTGRLREVFWLANPSYMPITLATGLAISLGAMIFDSYWLSALGLVIALIAYLVWMNPRQRPTENDKTIEEKFKRFGVAVYRYSSPTIARWSLFLTMGIALTTLGTFLFTYFFLSTNTPVWPPESAKLGGWTAAVLAQLFTVSGLVIVAWTQRYSMAGGRTKLIRHLAIASVLDFVAGGLQIWAYSQLSFSWTSHAYGSIFYLLAAFQLFMLITALVMASIALFRLNFNHDPAEQERVQVTVENARRSNYVMLACWLAIFFTLYLSPHLM